MAIVSMNSLLRQAQQHRYMVGYFESWNLESLLAVVDAAEHTRSPVIIGFNGGFLDNPERPVKENIYHYGALGITVAREAGIPICLLMNEAAHPSTLLRAIQAGFNAIMYAGSHDTPEELLETTRYLVRTAHACSVAVEAEAGTLPWADGHGGLAENGRATDPDEASAFVKETSVDALAVSVGNVHVLEGSTVSLDWELLAHIHRKVSVPLVLHGGTGIDRHALREAAGYGVAKVNVGTLLKRACLDSWSEIFRTPGRLEDDPHALLGGGGKQDMNRLARERMAEKVANFMEDLGSTGKA